MRLAGAALLALLAIAAAAVPPGAAAAEQSLGEFVPETPPQPAPAIGFADASGKTLTLSDFAGKPVLVNLWATWCAPCRREMPSLDRLQRRLGDRLTVLAISEDMTGKKAVEPFIAKLGLTALRTYLDPKSTVGRAFKVDGLPTSFLIDREGRVVGRVEGEAQWDSSKMLSVIEPLLAPSDIVKTSVTAPIPPKHP